jgi:hypothetical protein
LKKDKFDIELDTTMKEWKGFYLAVKEVYPYKIDIESIPVEVGIKSSLFRSSL